MPEINSILHGVGKRHNWKGYGVL